MLIKKDLYNMSYKTKNHSNLSPTTKPQSAFTIVELLVIIVIIGILAAITVVSYTGISNQATVASLQLDLASAAKQLKLFQVDNGVFPTTISTDCDASPTTTTNLCLKPTPGNIFTHASYPYTRPTTQSFSLAAVNGSNIYRITENSSPFALTAPILINPTSTAIASTTATIQADGGADITEIGTCWGTSSNPTTNCTPKVPGALTANGTIATGTWPQGMTISADGSSVYATNNMGSTISIFNRNNQYRGFDGSWYDC